MDIYMINNYSIILSLASLSLKAVEQAKKEVPKARNLLIEIYVAKKCEATYLEDREII